MKNILKLSFFGALLLLLGAAGYIVDPLFLVPTAGVGMYTPEVISEID